MLSASSCALQSRSASLHLSVLRNRFLTARLKPSPTENCITAACQVRYRIAENCAFTKSLTKIHSIGVLAAALKEHHWDQGPVGLVTISLARNNGKARTKGFRDAMKENGDIKEVALDQMQRYTADETFKYVQDMLTAHPDLHGIFVQTDTPTLGAVRAIQAAHRQDTVLLAAFDGVPEFIDLIRQGKIVASGMQQPFQMGVESAKAMFDYLEGKKPPKEILVPIIVVSQKNLDEVLPTIERTVFANELKK
jgi:ribose transport system substrate-binding protein